MPWKRGRSASLLNPVSHRIAKTLINHDDNDDNSPSDGNNCMRPRSPRSQHLLGHQTTPPHLTLTQTLLCVHFVDLEAEKVSAPSGAPPDWGPRPLAVFPCFLWPVFLW